MKKWIFFGGFSLLAAGAMFLQHCKSNSGNDLAGEAVSYNYDIRPILSDKCFACHGPDANKRQAGLRLDIADSALAPLKESPGLFALKPGYPDSSEVYRRISSTDPDYQMPTPESHLGLLSEKEIALIKTWIRQGARYEKHWAFIPPKKLAVPKVESSSEWQKNEIDAFILRKLEVHNLEPNAEADAHTLVRRAALDLNGLVPKNFNAGIKKFTDAQYEHLIDSLLASPHYGERMALHWLDVARYSDSYGYQDDNLRTQWPYRDWVIHAFNSNLSYRDFIIYQLAGDMLPNANKEQILATAFLRNHKYTEEGGVIPEEYRVEYLVDKVKTYSKGLLALTVECAQCHDHKYDPISQKDYYSLFAFFNKSKELGFEGDVTQSKPAKQPVMFISNEDRSNLMSFVQNPDTAPVMVSVMGEVDTLRTTNILLRGVYNSYGSEVLPSALPAVKLFDTTRYKPNRLGLAQWTVSNDNPLAARAFVNQVWQELFGRGLVKTSGDFGMQGSLPSHPELLDWLAVDFMEHNWDIKYLMKKIMMSATYRQSSHVSKKHLETDPENIYLARQTRNRLPAEIIRDVVLSSAGLLSNMIGGPSVKPYQPPGLWEAATPGRGLLQEYKQDHDSLLYRRGIYTFIKLTLPPPGMMMFDASNRDQCEVKRLKTSTPLQALLMLNDPTVLEAARVMAERKTKEKRSAEQSITDAFQHILYRTPSASEKKTLLDLYNYYLAKYKANPLLADKTLDAGEWPHLKNALNKPEAGALMQTLVTIYNLEEVITKT